MLHVCERNLSNSMYEYEANRLTNEIVIIGKRNFNANCLRRWTPARPSTMTNSPIYKSKVTTLDARPAIHHDEFTNL